MINPFNPWNSFPSFGVVFVDANFVRIRGNGQLAYGTVDEAIAAHRVGGAAEVRYGPYDATNRPIILGRGSFTPAAQMTVDVDNLIIGGILGAREAFEVSASIAGSVFDVTASNVEFFNMRVSNLSTGDAAFSITGGLVVKFTNIDFTSSTGAFVTGKVVTSAGIVSSIYKFCKMPVDGPGGGAMNWNGDSDLTVEDSEIVFNPGGGNFISLPSGSGMTAAASWRRILFSGSSGGNGGFFNSDATTVSCLFEDIYSIATGGLFFLVRCASGTINCVARRISGENGGFNITATFIGLFDANFSGILEDSKVINVGANGHALTVTNGARVRHNILIGNGTGLAINGAGATIEANLNTVRLPTGDVAGTWTDATLSPVSNQYNAEVFAATTS